MTDNEVSSDAQLDLKKRARRRLVGAAALALLAVIVLPMVMDHDPKPSGAQDIQVRIPSQDAPFSSAAPGASSSKGSAGKVVEPTIPAAPAVAAVTPAADTTRAPTDKPKTDTPAAPSKTDTAKPVSSPESAKSPATESASQEKDKGRESKDKSKDKSREKPVEPAKADAARATAALEGKGSEQWILQLGAYQDPANVKVLQGKLKELGYASYTEKIDTPQGTRIRVRGGPFPTQEAAERAQSRLKKIGAGGPPGGVVSRK